MPVTPDILEILQTHREMVAINSVGLGLPGCVHAERHLTAYLEDWLTARGIRHCRQELTQGRANIIATLPGATPALLMTAHMDTVSTKGMEIQPFAPELREGRIYGRGACDTKASLACMLGVLAAFSRSRAPLPGGLALLATCGEETNFEGAEAFANRPLLEPRAVLVGEPTLCRPVTAHKAVARYRLRVPGRAAHGATPEAGRNAIDLMARLLCRIQESLVPALAENPHPLCGPHTINIGTISGGTQVNFVPDSCEVHVDQRIHPGRDARELLRETQERIRALAAEAGIEGVEFEETLFAPGMETDSADAFTGLCLEASGAEAPLGVPYGTDAGSLSRLGAPCVVLGPGSIAQAHRPVEYVEQIQLIQCVEIYLRIAAGSVLREE